MHHDFQPYYAPDASHGWVETDHAKEAGEWMKPMTAMRPSKVVEIPANWYVSYVPVSKFWDWTGRDADCS